jgi:hypothetical protein
MAPAGWQSAALGGDALGQSPQLHFLGEQSVARSTVLGALTREMQVAKCGG